MQRALILLAAAYSLHFTWEMGQGFLFEPMDRLPFATAAAWCARAAGWDVLISAAAYLTAALAARRMLWLRERRWWPLVIYLAAGLAVTIAIEKWAVATGRWKYREAMPAIAGIGLAPLLQWIIIPVVILIAARRLYRASESPPVSPPAEVVR